MADEVEERGLWMGAATPSPPVEARAEEEEDETLSTSMCADVETRGERRVEAAEAAGCAATGAEVDESRREEVETD